MPRARSGAVGISGVALACASVLAACALDGAGATGARDGGASDAQRPAFGPAVTAARPPPPLSGGTLLVTRDGRTAVAADPDRDRVWLVDLARRALRAEVPLEPGDEPGRIAEDDAGRAHVALRRGGAVVTIDVASGAVVARREACPAPRGIAFDPAARGVHVVCAGGEFVALPLDGGAPRVARTGVRDLRDVLATEGTLFVTRFRAADVAWTVSPETPLNGSAFVALPGASVRGEAAPDAAWRAIRRADGSFAVLHQRARVDGVSLAPGGYGANGVACQQTGIVHATITVLRTGRGPTVSPAIPTATLAVDLASSPDNQAFAVVAPGNARVPDAPQLFVLRAAEFERDGSCAFVPPETPQPRGQAVAVAYAPDGTLVVQTREPAGLFLPGTRETVALPGASREDTGHAVFHANAGAFVACASCHLEGGDDGRVWRFEGLGARRTQSLRGGIAGTEPFHWDGDLRDLPHLVDEVFVHRMRGAALDGDQVRALGRWIESIPRLPRVAHGGAAWTAAVARGRALFENPTVACASCHAGTRLTHTRSYDVGTGGAFQVPSLLGVAWRTPLMHNGCASTVRARFDVACGGAAHGVVDHLPGAAVDDLTAYLESL